MNKDSFVSIFCLTSILCLIIINIAMIWEISKLKDHIKKIESSNADALFIRDFVFDYANDRELKRISDNMIKLMDK